MQRVHSATITRQVSLLIFAIIYYRSIDSCVHTTVLWRVEDTKYLSEHRACMRRGSRTTATGRSKKDKRFHASLEQIKIFCFYEHLSHEDSSVQDLSLEQSYCGLPSVGKKVVVVVVRGGVGMRESGQHTNVRINLEQF